MISIQNTWEGEGRKCPKKHYCQPKKIGPKSTFVKAFPQMKLTGPMCHCYIQIYLLLAPTHHHNKTIPHIQFALSNILLSSRLPKDLFSQCKCKSSHSRLTLKPVWFERKVVYSVLFSVFFLYEIHHLKIRLVLYLYLVFIFSIKKIFEYKN